MESINRFISIEDQIQDPEEKGMNVSVEASDPMSPYP